MKASNAFVAAVLRSPVHGFLSGTTALIRYTGRRSGRRITTPTQYVRNGDEVLILVGRPESKTWWRNFGSDRDIDVLVRGRWLQMTAVVVRGEDEPEVITPLLGVYLKRFPRAKASLGNGSTEEMARRAVMVRCRPR